jgi:uncharacterized protein YfaS (alpha-2-macroglobulin family)
LILAQIKSSKLNQGELYAYQFLQATDFVLIENVFSNHYKYQVVGRSNGKPIEGAKVQLTSRFPGSVTNPVNEVYITNNEGYVETVQSGRYDNTIKATISQNGQQATFGDYYLYRINQINENNEPKTTGKAFLFTDRSIYRPGQTVFFKGILIKTKDKKSSVVAGEYVMVTLYNVNDEEVGTLRLKSNSFGSFSGEFKLPGSGLNGEYTLTADEDDEDSYDFYENLYDFQSIRTAISVEEYKRPTFEAQFEPVKEAFVLYEKVAVKGKAVALNGSFISSAKVNYRVKRNAQYPHWYYWYNKNSYSSSQEIISGDTVTDINGSFTINFNALPDPKSDKSGRPVFHYEITADITDVNGETRTATTIVKVGYHSLDARIEVQPVIQRNVANTISVITENLNGEFIPGNGKVRIYKLKSPSNPIRERLWEAPDQEIPENEFREKFPNDPFDEITDSRMWPKGKLLMNFDFNTALSKEVKMKATRQWELGKYLIELHTTDPSGDSIQDFYHFKLIDSLIKLLPIINYSFLKPIKVPIKSGKQHE